MSAQVKRPGIFDSESRKKAKKENCPHAERCYRRNPHHFLEYQHPHLIPFLPITSKPTFPDSFKQDPQVYLDQLAVLKDLEKSNKPGQPGPSTSSTKKPNATNESPKITQSNDLNKKDNKNEVKPIAKIYGSKLKPEKIFETNKEKSYRFIKNTAKNMKERLELCAPYNIFFTKVPEAHQTLDGYNCISFPDLICPSLGKLINSLQINFMIDISWLMEQYEVHNLHKVPMTIIYGYEFPMMDVYIAKNLPHVKAHEQKLKDPFGVHHSKIGIYKYENESIRIVVSTANLYYEDWNHYNQGLWMSPECPKMDDTKNDYECAGPTGFKTDLLFYLNSYSTPLLKEWIQLVKRADFSAVKVFFVCSVPGQHFAGKNGAHLQKVGDLLSKHCDLPVKTGPDSEGALSWGVIAQSSSLGSFGKTAGDWLRPVLLRSLASHKKGPLPNTPNATLNLVYPTVNNVLQSHFGPQGGGCLPYQKSVNAKQPWLKEYLHVWKADGTGRTRAMPHIKSYCRVSPCLTKLAWFLLTSANISISAWGGKLRKDFSCSIRSFEAGVMFSPDVFNEEYFFIKREIGDSDPVFPFMYDLPLEPYKDSDEPWCN